MADLNKEIAEAKKLAATLERTISAYQTPKQDSIAQVAENMNPAYRGLGIYDADLADMDT